jgi:hypothetical protein
MWSYALTAFGVCGLLIAGEKNVWGWAVCIGSQVPWAVYAVQTHQMGFFYAAIIYSSVYGRNFLKWRRKAKSPACTCACTCAQ